MIRSVVPILRAPPIHIPTPVSTNAWRPKNKLLLGLALGNSTDYVPARPIMLSARPQKASVFSISQGSELNLYMEEVGDRNSQSSWGVHSASSMYVTLLDGTSFNEFGETKAPSYNQVSAE